MVVVIGVVIGLQWGINNGFLICFAALDRTSGAYAQFTFPVAYTSLNYVCLTGPKGYTKQNGYFYWNTQNHTLTSVEGAMTGNSNTLVGKQIYFGVFGY